MIVDPRPVGPLLEAVYRVDLDDDAWLSGLRSTVADARTASIAAIVQPDPGGVSLRAASMSGESAKLIQQLAVGRADGTVIFPVKVPVLTATQSAAMGYPLPEPFRSAYWKFGGYRDCWGVFGTSPCGTTAFIGQMLRERVRLDGNRRRFWSAVAQHLAAAARLRTAIRAESEAVLEPGGKLLHAEGIAREPAFRESLRRAAKAMDRARVGREDPVSAIETWTALVECRWSLVDEFERDGRRFVVARVNEPPASGDACLTQRQRQVLALVALGRSNKQIAYELGLSLSSVASHVRRAARRLGVRARRDLIARGSSK